MNLDGQNSGRTGYRFWYFVYINKILIYRCKGQRDPEKAKKMLRLKPDPLTTEEEEYEEILEINQLAIT